MALPGSHFKYKEGSARLGVQVAHVLREGNCGANYLAKKGMEMQAATKWTDKEKGKHLRGLIRADRLHFFRRRFKN